MSGSLFYPAVFLGSWLGGRAGGLLATMISIGLVNYFFMEPIHSFHVFSASYRLSLVMFTLMGALFAFSLHRMQTNNARQLAAAGRFRTLFEEAPLGVALIDSHTGRIYEINPRFAEIAGRAREDMVTIDWMSITHPDDIQGDLDNMARLNAGDIPGFQMDKRYLKPDGTVVWISMTIAPVSVAPGESPRHLCMIEDITERRAAEQRQREVNDRLLLANDIADIGIWDWDLVNNRLEWDDRMCAWYGLTPEEREAGFQYDRWRSSVHPDDLFAAETTLQQAVASGEPWNATFRICRSNGCFRHIHAAAIVYRDDHHQPVRVLGINQDITSEQEHLTALAEARAQLEKAVIENRLIALVEQNLVGFVELDNDGRIERVNDRFAALLGYRPDELSGRSVRDITDARDWPESEAHLRELKQSGHGFKQEKRYYRKDGSLFWGKVVAMPVGGPDGRVQGTVALLVDIDACKQAEQNLRLAMEGSQIGMYDWDLASGKITWMGEHERLWGYRPGEFDGSYEAFARRLHPDDRDGVSQQIALARNSRQPYRHLLRVVWPDGSVHWINGRGEFEYDAEGQPLHMRGMVIDITDTIQALARLRQSEERLALATEGAGIGIWHWDIVRDLVEVSSLCQQHLALPDGAALSYPLFLSVLHPDDRDRIDQSVQAAVREHQNYATEYRVLHDDGSQRWIEAAGRALYDAAGKAVALIGITRDITERKLIEENLQESERRFRNLFEHLPIAYQSLDIQGRWLDANQKLADLLGFATPDELLGRDFIDYWDDTIKDQFHCQYDDFKLNQLVEGELLLHRTDGQPINVQIAGRIQRDADGRFLRTHCILVDMTERRAMENEILALNADLEIKVAERTRQLAAANAAKSQFLASMSHEIRTPMNAVLGLAQLLEYEPLTEDQLQMVHRINSAGRSLLGIINDILDYSKIEAGQLSVEQRPFKLPDLLSHIDSLMGPVAQGKGLNLRLKDDATMSGRLSGDALRIEQVLINLVGNALKFTEQGGVTIRVAPVNVTEASARLRFEIQDTGIGMSPEAVAKLFQPFTQADSGIARRFGGTGLGLSISKRLVELMGGEIGVTSTSGVGSTFWFELPFDRLPDEDQPETSAAEVKGPRLQGLRLLVVDDSQINLYLAERVLKREGAEITLMKDGQQALEALRAQPQGYDLVLMDIQMPVMDGLTATRAIREELGLDTLPVIALTAGVLAEEKQNALDAGVNDFLPKPMDLDLMATMIRSYCPAHSPNPTG